MVDEAAKAATTEGVAMDLPISLAALRQRINSAYKRITVDTPGADVIKRLRGSYDPISTRKALMQLPRPAAAAIAQLRANHTPLAAFLHQIQAVDDPNCDMCHQPETAEHYLMLCRKYVTARQTLFKALRKLKVPRKTQAILTYPQAFKPLATYIEELTRFIRTKPWKPPPSASPTPATTPNHPRLPTQRTSPPLLNTNPHLL